MDHPYLFLPGHSCSSATMKERPHFLLTYTLSSSWNIIGGGINITIQILSHSSLLQFLTPTQFSKPRAPCNSQRVNIQSNFYLDHYKPSRVDSSQMSGRQYSLKFQRVNTSLCQYISQLIFSFSPAEQHLPSLLHLSQHSHLHP